VLLFLNIIAAMHAYKFTHFKNGGIRTERIHLTTTKKIQLLFTGVDNPRPVNNLLPSYPYRTVTLNSNVKIECWDIPSVIRPTKGTVIMCHGYTSNKSALLSRADVLLKNGYDCLLVDFMGSGGSEGNQTTVGYKEAIEVRDCFNYLAGDHRRNIYLYGSSMGAVAIMKAIKDYDLKPSGIIIECPFSSMYETICVRFRMLHTPSFPLAGMLLFWGSVENQFWGFSHNPAEYATHIKCPTLLQYGAKDDRVGRQEIGMIYARLNSPKKLMIYPTAGHDNFLRVAKNDWNANVLSFLDQYSQSH
jgi:alpha-beta hydrolase superfamily lysophospholipase